MPAGIRYPANIYQWCCVFDAEVCVTEDPRAVMVIAVTSDVH